MIAVCCKWVGELWKLRNSKLHGKDEESRKITDREKATREIKALYSIRDKALPRHQDVFMDTAEEHIERLKTTCHLKTWIDTFRPQLASSSQAATKAAVQDVIDKREHCRSNDMEADIGNVKTKTKTRKSKEGTNKTRETSKSKT